MKPAGDYPVTFGYGAQDGRFYGPGGSVGAYHKGDDRSCDVGSPVIVNGVTIGLSGNTGASSGPHLHVGRFVNGQATNPQHGGFLLTNAKVLDTGEDARNGKFVRVQGSGALWIYCHLSQVRANKGQQLSVPAPVIGDEVMPIRNAEFINNMYRFVAGREATQAERDLHSRGTPESLLNGFIANSDVAVARLQSELNTAKSEAVYLKQELEKLKADEAKEDAAEAEAKLKPAEVEAVKPAVIEQPPAPKKPSLFVRLLAGILTKKK